MTRGASFWREDHQPRRPRTAAQVAGVAAAVAAAAVRNREDRLDGLAFAARWKSGGREEALTRAAVVACGLSPRPAIGTFPYPHRTCAEW